MTENQYFAIQELMKCRYIPGSFDKKFINQQYHATAKNPARELMESTWHRLLSMVYKYRRQIPVCYNMFKAHPKCKPLK